MLGSTLGLMFATAACNARQEQSAPVLSSTPPPISAPVSSVRASAAVVPASANVAPTPGVVSHPGVVGIEAGTELRTLAFLPSGKTLLGVGWDGVLSSTDPVPTPRGVWVWDLARGTKIRTIPFADVEHGASAGQRIFVDSQDGSVHLWDLDQDKEIFSSYAEGAPVNAVALSQDGKLAAAVGEGGKLNIWTIGATTTPFTVTLAQGKLHTVAFTPDGRFVIVGTSERTALIVNANTGRVRATFAGHDERLATIDDQPVGVWSLATSPDGTLVATGSWDGVVRLWKAQTEGRTSKPAQALEGHNDLIMSLAFSADGRVVASGSRDGTARAWSVTAGKSLGTFKPDSHGGTPWSHFVTAVALSTDGTTLATGDGSGAIRFYALSP